MYLMMYATAVLLLCATGSYVYGSLGMRRYKEAAFYAVPMSLCAIAMFLILRSVGV